MSTFYYSDHYVEWQLAGDELWCDLGCCGASLPEEELKKLYEALKERFKNAEVKLCLK